MTNPLPLISIREVCERLGGIHQATAYRMIEKGQLPEPIRIGERTARWRADEIDAYIESRANPSARHRLQAPHQKRHAEGSDR